MANGILETAFLSDSSQDSARSDTRAREIIELSAHAADGGGGASSLSAFLQISAEDKEPLLPFLHHSQAGSQTPRLGSSPVAGDDQKAAGAFPDVETAEQDEAEAAAGPLSARAFWEEKEKPSLFSSSTPKPSPSPKVSPPSQSRESIGDGGDVAADAAEVYFIGTPPVLPPGSTNSLASTSNSLANSWGSTGKGCYENAPLSLPRGNMLPSADWASSPRDALRGSPRDLRGALTSALEEVRGNSTPSTGRSAPSRPLVPWNPAGVGPSRDQPLARTASNGAMRADVRSPRVGSVGRATTGLGNRENGASTTPRQGTSTSSRNGSRAGGADRRGLQGAMSMGTFVGAGNGRHGSNLRNGGSSRPRSVERTSPTKAAPVRQASGAVLASTHAAVSRRGHASSVSRLSPRVAQAPAASSSHRRLPDCDSPLQGTVSAGAVATLEGPQGLLTLLERLAPASPEVPLAVPVAGRQQGRPSASPVTRGPDFKPRDWVSNLRSSGSKSTLSPRPVSTGRMPSPRRAWSPAGTSPPKWMPMSAGAPPPSARAKAEALRSESPLQGALPLAQVQESPRFAVPPPPAALLGRPASARKDQRDS